MDTFIIATVAFIMLALYWLFVKPIIDYSLWIDWWNQNDGPTFNCLDITALAYYNSNYLVYTLYNFIQSGNSRFETDAEVRFISNLINSYASGIAQNGKLLPKHLCQSLVRTQRQNGQNYPTNALGWFQLISSWADANTSTPTGTGANWNDPDNFLNDWGIQWNSPIVQSYLTDVGSKDQYPNALKYLLNIDGYSGSFVGMMRYISSASESTGDFENIIWTISPEWYNSQGTPNTKDPSVKKCTTANNFGSIFQSGTTGVFLGTMLMEAVGGPIAIGIGLAATIGGSLVGADQNDCF